MTGGASGLSRLCQDRLRGKGQLELFLVEALEDFQIDFCLRAQDVRSLFDVVNKYNI